MSKSQKKWVQRCRGSLAKQLILFLSKSQKIGSADIEDTLQNNWSFLLESYKKLGPMTSRITCKTTDHFYEQVTKNWVRWYRGSFAKQLIIFIRKLQKIGSNDIEDHLQNNRSFLLESCLTDPFYEQVTKNLVRWYRGSLAKQLIIFIRKLQKIGSNDIEDHLQNNWSFLWESHKDFVRWPRGSFARQLILFMRKS